jgi:transcription initiation factor TFIIB
MNHPHTLEQYTNSEIELLLLGIYGTQSEPHQRVCDLCESTESIEDYAQGIVVCRCGQVIDTLIDFSMDRVYDDDRATVSKQASLHNKLLPVSSLGSHVAVRGKLKQLHIWNSMPYKERSNNVMFKRIHEICMIHRISRKISDDAKIICKHVSGTLHLSGKNVGKNIITRGFNRSGIVAACLYVACRRNEETRTSREISNYFMISERDVNKGLRSLLGILENNQIISDIGTSKIAHFIRRKCDEMRIKKRHADVAMMIANNLDRLNVGLNHTTYSLAAACILLMGDTCGLDLITKKAISTAFFELSDVTIAKTFKQLKSIQPILQSGKKVDMILEDMVVQANKKHIRREVWDMMVRFGVDTSGYVMVG